MKIEPMNRLIKKQLSITTDSGGDASVSFGNVDGMIMQFRYVPDGSSPLATGADIDLVGDDTGVTIIDEDNIGTSAFERVPTQSGHTADGTESGQYYPFVVSEALTLTIANGGNAKIGVFHLWYLGVF